MNTPPHDPDQRAVDQLNADLAGAKNQPLHIEPGMPLPRLACFEDLGGVLLFFEDRKGRPIRVVTSQIVWYGDMGEEGSNRVAIGTTATDGATVIVKGDASQLDYHFQALATVED